MKEAAGEANMTVVTILLIAIVSAVGTIVIRNMMNNTKTKACCLDNGGAWYQNKCYNDVDDDGKGTGGTFTPDCKSTDSGETSES